MKKPSWQRVLAWYAEHAPKLGSPEPPATDGELDVLREQVPGLPNSIESLLRISNGEQDMTGLLGGFVMLSSEGVASQFTMLSEATGSAELIPFASDFGGDLVAVSATDGSAWRFRASVRVAESLDAFLALFAAELESGIWSLGTDEDGGDALVHRDGAWIGGSPIQVPTEPGALLTFLVSVPRAAWPEEIAVLRAAPLETMLAADEAMEGAPYHVRGKYLLFVANALGTDASDWVQRFAEDHEIGEATRARAVVEAWPAGGGRDLVEELSKFLPGSRSILLLALAGPELLAWLESQPPATIKELGPGPVLASKPEWARMAAWLERGRPWSHIALVVIMGGLTTGVSGRANRCELLPVSERGIVDCPSLEVIGTALERHAERDPVPRVTKDVRKMLLALR